MWDRSIFSSKRFVNWTLNMKLFLFWFSRWCNRGVISGSQMDSQLLQNTKIIKQTDVLLWKIWRKYGSVSYLFSCMLRDIDMKNKVTKSRRNIKQAGVIKLNKKSNIFNTNLATQSPPRWAIAKQYYQMSC